MLQYFFLHYVLCLTGALTRFLFYKIKSISTKNNDKEFKDFYFYYEKPDIEMLDAVLGSFVLGVIVYILFKFFIN